MFQLSFSDADYDRLTYRITSYPRHGQITGSTSNALTYTPDPKYYGSDSLTFVVNDGQADSNEATVWFTVARVNHPPMAVPQQVIALKDLPRAVTLHGVDPDGDLLDYRLASSPSHGTLSGTGATLTYTPKAGYVGSDSFSFYVSDGTEQSPPATVRITVRAENHAPQVKNLRVSIVGDAVAAINLIGTDADGDELRYIITSRPAHGTLVQRGPSVTYTPDPGFVGPDRFTYRANDGFVDSATATVSIEISAPVTSPASDGS